MRWNGRLTMLALVACAAPGFAQPTLPAMPGYKHTAFTVEDGAPSGANVIAQTPDGFLWIGTTQGLWRFDGIGFERVAALEKPGGAGVRSLVVTRKGDLWLGYGFGGVARTRGGRILPLPALNAPDGWIDSMAEAPDGAIWLTSRGGLYRYADGRWVKRMFGDRGGVYRILASRDGAIWACVGDSTQHRLVRLDAGTLSATIMARLGGGECALGQHPDGDVLVTDQARLLAPQAAPSGKPLPAIAVLPGHMTLPAFAIGRNGDAWIVGYARQILRVALRNTARARQSDTVLFESAVGAANYSTQPFEDREGNWWIGTDRGIDRFHPVDLVQNSIIDPLLRKVSATEPNPYQVLVDGRSTVFVRIDRHFFRIAADGRAVPVAIAGLESTDLVCAAKDAGLWVRTAPDTMRLLGGDRARSVRIASIKPLGRASRCFEDRDGRLWLGISPIGFVRYDRDDRNPKVVQLDDRPNGYPYLMAQGHDGLLTYAGYGDAAAFDGKAFRPFIGRQHNPFAFIGTMLQRPDGLLIGGENGLGMLRGGRVHRLPAGENGLFGDVSGLVQNAVGETWLLSQAGLVRLSTATLSARLEGRSGALRPHILDHEDGLVARSSIRGFTDLVEAANGRLWLANQTGIYSLDPRRLTRNALPPPVVVRSIKANGKSVAPAPQLRLSAGTRSLEIDFTALSLGVPRRVAFRYRLDGVDADWTDPGARRQAIYTGLRPGSYRFQVIASNDDGVWNRTGAVVEIVIPPTFVESCWFVLLCVLAALALGWMLYSLRIRRLNRRFDALLYERLDERERIARDLHDTLLQGLQGLMLRFQAIVNRLPADSDLRSSADQALDRAEAVIVEGRDKVRDLRSEASGPPLEQRIGDGIASLAQDEARRTTLMVEGSPRPLAGRVVSEATAIAEEALRNAHRHAAAEHVEMVVTYGLAALTLVVRDDGRGIDPELAAARRGEGHFGLVGMDERAARAGGTLKVSTRRGRGTEIVLSIPALAAYGRQRGHRPPFRSGGR